MPTKEQLEKLPLWARSHISELERERENAIQALSKHLDSQTPSPYLVEGSECLGEKKDSRGSGPTLKRYYIQAGGRPITIRAFGVDMTVLVNEDDKCIDLAYASESRLASPICLQPYCYQRIRFLSKDNMR